ncbi:MAG: TonB-dependent receptor [Roseovarius sp.]|nr:TonB-dependent receptor [Roseovarius sp.]
MERHVRRALTTSTCLCLAWWGMAPATAQQAGADASRNAPAPGEEGFLGTITLGESKRAVQTQTATPSTVVNEAEIRDRQAGTVAELVDSVPGVALVNGDTKQGSGISIRGFGSNQTFGTDQKVLIQVDGATRGAEELYRIGTQLFNDPFLYEEAEVIRGTVGSFEYGSGVVGGVVRLNTIDPEDVTGGETGTALRQTLEFQTNGNGLTSSTIGAWQPTEDFGLMVNYTERNLGFPEDGNGTVINPLREEIDDPSWLIKGKYRFGEGKAHSVEASYQSTRSAQFDVPYDSFGNLTFFGNVDREIEAATTILKYAFNPVSDLVDLSLQYSHADERVRQDPVSCPGSPPAPVTICSPLLDADTRYETTTLELKNTAFFKTGMAAHDLTMGIKYAERDRNDNDAASAPGGSGKRWAIYAVNEISVGDAWTLKPALRYETNEVTGQPPGNTGQFTEDALMGGFSARYDLGNGLAVFGSAAYTEVMPVIDDLEFRDRVNQTEKSRTYEVGVSYNKSDVITSRDTLAVKATYFDTELWDVTSFTDAAMVPIDEVRTQGFEIEASYAMENGFYSDLNATISDGEEVDGSGIRDWRNQSQDNLRLTVGKVFDDTYDLSWETVLADSITINGTRSSGYDVHNLRLTVTPGGAGVWKNTEFRAGIENILDAQYTPNLASRPEPGRSFKFTLAKTF